MLKFPNNHYFSVLFLFSQQILCNIELKRGMILFEKNELTDFSITTFSVKLLIISVRLMHHFDVRILDY